MLNVPSQRSAQNKADIAAVTDESWQTDRVFNWLGAYLSRKPGRSSGALSPLLQALTTSRLYAVNYALDVLICNAPSPV